MGHTEREHDINAIAAQLFEQTPAASGTPTDSDVLSSLTEQPLTAEDVEFNPTGTVLVCILPSRKPQRFLQFADAIDFDDFAVGDMAIKLPCKHAFKKDNISTWLKDHNTCPVCRHALQGASSAGGQGAAAAAGGGDTARPAHAAAAEQQEPQTTDPFSGFMSLIGGMLDPSQGGVPPRLPMRGTSQFISFQTGPRGTRISRGVHPIMQPSMHDQPPQDEDAQLQAAIQASLEEDASRREAAQAAAAVRAAPSTAAAQPSGSVDEFTEVQALIRSSLSALSPEEVMRQAQREGIPVGGKTRGELEDLIVAAMMGEAHATVLAEDAGGEVQATAPPAAAEGGAGGATSQTPAAQGGEVHAGGPPFSAVYPPVQPGCNEYILTVQLPQQLQLVLGFPADASLGQVYSTVWGMQREEGDGAADTHSAPNFSLVDEHSGEELQDFGLQLQESRLPREGGSLVLLER